MTYIETMKCESSDYKTNFILYYSFCLLVRTQKKQAFTSFANCKLRPRDWSIYPDLVCFLILIDHYRTTSQTPIQFPFSIPYSKNYDRELISEGRVLKLDRVPKKSKFSEWPTEFSVYSRDKYKNFLLTKFLKIFQNARGNLGSILTLSFWLLGVWTT